MSPRPQAVVGLVPPRPLSAMGGEALSLASVQTSQPAAFSTGYPPRFDPRARGAVLDEVSDPTPPAPPFTILGTPTAPPATAITDTSSTTTTTSPPNTRSLIAAAAAGAAGGILLLALALLVIRAVRRRGAKHAPPSPPPQADSFTRQPDRRAHAQTSQLSQLAPAHLSPCTPPTPRSRASSERTRALVSPLSPLGAPGPSPPPSPFHPPSPLHPTNPFRRASALARAPAADTAPRSTLAALAHGFPLPPGHTVVPHGALARAFDEAYAALGVGELYAGECASPELGPEADADADIDADSPAYSPAYSPTPAPALNTDSHADPPLGAHTAPATPAPTTPTTCPKLEAEGGVRVNTSPLPSAEQMRAEALARILAATATPASTSPVLSRIPRWRSRSRSAARDGGRARRRRAVDGGVVMNGTARRASAAPSPSLSPSLSLSPDFDAEGEEAWQGREGRRQRRGRRPSPSPAPTTTSTVAGTVDTHATAGTLPPAYARYG